MNIFFDLDGTLIDTSYRNYNVYREIILNLKGKPLTKYQYWRLKRSKSNLSRILKLSQISTKYYSVYTQKFRDEIESVKHLNKDSLFPFTLNSLNTLLALKHNLFLISYRQSKSNALEELKDLGLNKKFKKIMIGRLNDSASETKASFIKDILGKEKSPKQSVIVIGDNEDDIIAAKNQNIISISVLSGIRNKQVLQRLHPHFIIKDISFLQELIDKNILI